MFRRLTRLALVLAAAAGIAAVVRAFRRDEDPLPSVPGGPPTEPWPPLPPSQEPVQAPAGPAGAWADPAGDACPDGYPIKAKLTSGIFHSPGQLNYERTVPDRCYATAADAEADGLRPAKR